MRRRTPQQERQFPERTDRDCGVLVEMDEVPVEQNGVEIVSGIVLQQTLTDIEGPSSRPTRGLQGSYHPPTDSPACHGGKRADPIDPGAKTMRGKDVPQLRQRTA